MRLHSADHCGTSRSSPHRQVGQLKRTLERIAQHHQPSPGREAPTHRRRSSAPCRTWVDSATHSLSYIGRLLPPPGAKAVSSGPCAFECTRVTGLLALCIHPSRARPMKPLLAVEDERASDGQRKLALLCATVGFCQHMAPQPPAGQ